MKARGRALIAPFPLLALLALTACQNPLRARIERLVGDYESIVREQAVYVDGTRGDDENPGTRQLPRRSIQGAVDLLAALGIRGEARVAEGVYLISSPLRIAAGIAVRGGYSGTDWEDRDIEGCPTTLTGSGVEHVVGFVEGAGRDAVLEGFTVEAAAGQLAICVYCESCSPTIRYNHLDASRGGKDSIGIFNFSSSPLIEANTIDAGLGTDSCWGIANSASAPQVRNNVIFSSSDDGGLRAIYNGSSSPAVIQNNTIHIGGHPDDVGICSVSGRCVIENNIIYSAPAAACGLREADDAASPLRVNNNDLFGCATLYDCADDDLDTVAEMEGYLASRGVPASDNVCADPLFVQIPSRDYHLAGGSQVDSKGLDLSASFTTDRDGIFLRTAPWSMGAYERD